MIRSAACSLAAAVVLGPCASSDAAIVPITSNTALSTEGLGAFIGSLNYTFLGGTTGTLDVTLTNTTDASIGGYITAFMFRPPPELGAFSSSLTSSSFAAMTDIPAGSSGSPFTGSWIGGAGTGGSWLAGGAPGGGIGIGQTGMFSFTITGANASMLSSDAFVSGSLVSDPYAFIVRFRGLENGGSDKVPANELPAPGAIALLSLAGLGSGRRRRDGA
jgi:MYXO-CTERM domain-containing protein